MFIDGDFKTQMGDCKHHCSPTCHPGQTDPENWHYGCLHPAWPENKHGGFCPFVKCNGDSKNCYFKKDKHKIILKRYTNGLKRRIKNAKAKIDGYEKLLNEADQLSS